MDRLLIAPSTSPISSALAVPSGARPSRCKHPGDGLGDVEHAADRHSDDVAENAGDDDHGHGQRHVAAELFGYAHADGRRDGLGQERDVFLVREAKSLLITNTLQSVVMTPEKMPAKMAFQFCFKVQAFSYSGTARHTVAGVRR